MPIAVGIIAVTSRRDPARSANRTGDHTCNEAPPAEEDEVVGESRLGALGCGQLWSRRACARRTASSTVRCATVTTLTFSL